ncbi:MAG: hypothetical protein JJE28_03040 [Actinomycetales bacterium]|nr:hypothetical protein [Actinomycetales bacterium]
MTAEREQEALTAEPGDVIEFERDGQRFGGVVWQPPSQPGSMLAGDTFIRLRGEWIATTEHVASIRHRTPTANGGGE